MHTHTRELFRLQPALGHPEGFGQINGALEAECIASAEHRRNG